MGENNNDDKQIFNSQKISSLSESEANQSQTFTYFFHANFNYFFLVLFFQTLMDRTFMKIKL